LLISTSKKEGETGQAGRRGGLRGTARSHIGPRRSWRDLRNEKDHEPISTFDSPLRIRRGKCELGGLKGGGEHTISDPKSWGSSQHKKNVESRRSQQQTGGGGEERRWYSRTKGSSNPKKWCERHQPKEEKY